MLCQCCDRDFQSCTRFDRDDTLPFLDRIALTVIGRLPPPARIPTAPDGPFLRPVYPPNTPQSRRSAFRLNCIRTRRGSDVFSQCEATRLALLGIWRDIRPVSEIRRCRPNRSALNLSAGVSDVTDKPFCSDKFANAPISRSPSGSAASAVDWCFHWNCAATDFADRKFLCLLD